jgi:hypothetical protein
MSSSPPSDFSAQLTDALIKLLIAGSGGSAIYFLYVNELPKAAIALAITTGASLLTAFGEGVMARLRAGMQRRGEALGSVADQAMETTMSRTWAKLSGLHRQYHEALKVHCYALEVEGFQDLPGLALEDVFVPLRVESAQTTWGLPEGPQPIWNFLPQRDQAPNPHRRIAILAEPGYGKTTLLRHLTLTFVTQPPETAQPLMPILLRFRETYPLMRLVSWDDPGSDRPLNLPEVVVRHLSTQPEFRQCQPLSDTWFTDQLEQGRCLVMLDGLDEVPSTQRPAVRRWVDQQMKRYPATQFLLTSRSHGFELKPDDPSPAIAVDLKLRVLDFTPDQKQTFVERWYRTVVWRMKWDRLWQDSLRRPQAEQLTEAQARQKSDQEAEDNAVNLVRQIVNSPSLNDLARNPLLITMIASTHRAKTVLPKRRVELYDKIFDLLLGTRPYAKGNALTLTATECRAVLQTLAWHLATEETTLFSPAQGDMWIAGPLQRCRKERDLTPAQFWREMIDIAGLLVEKELGRYEFAHQTFQEYLTALYLRECGPEGEAFLLEQLTRDRWREVIRFYVALGDATAIINALLDIDGAEVTEYTLLLARHCLDEGREVDHNTLTRLQARLDSFTPEDLTSPDKLGLQSLRADLRLQQRFRRLTPLNAASGISTEAITRGEYQLFLTAQETGQFHSTARRLQGLDEGEADPMVDMPWEDARWFCAWLSTQTALQQDGKVFSYRLPTEANLRQIDYYASIMREQDDESAIVALSTDFYTLPRPWCDRPMPPGNVILVVREELNPRYQSLVNYLANGLWKQADLETRRIMLDTFQRPPNGTLSPEDVASYPCDDLRILDQLWVEFSGGHFGLSLQMQLYVEMGNVIGGDEGSTKAWSQFYEAAGWLVNGVHRAYEDFEFSLDSPSGHLPFWCSLPYQIRLTLPTPNMKMSALMWALFSRAKACDL